MSHWQVGWLLLAAFGLAYIVGHSTISLPIRLLLGGGGQLNPEAKPLIPFVGPLLISLVECPACFGFWEGFIFSLINGSAFLPAVVVGCAVSGSNFILGRLTHLI